MLHTYSVNLPGPSHLAGGVPCQDACCVANLGGGLVVAAVADGLGSESRSDVGSRVACEGAVAFCARSIGSCGDDGAVLDLMVQAFYRAYDAVLATAAEAGESAGEYDSTLCLAIFNGSKLFWGNAGDSGIVACAGDGTYRPVTAMHRDEEGRVFPLCFDETWRFGVEEGIASLLLCTDGILEDVLAPPLLRVHGGRAVDASKAEMFLHPRPDDAANLAEVERQAAEYFAAYPKELLDDDKTLVVVFDDERLPGRQPDLYYAEPDWPALVVRANASLYPDRKREELSEEAAGAESEAVVAPEVAAEEEIAAHAAPEARTTRCLGKKTVQVGELCTVGRLAQAGAGSAAAAFGGEVASGRTERRKPKKRRRPRGPKGRRAKRVWKRA